jgi:hypothetical protein
MDQCSMMYFRERERIEREAASKATCDATRHAHERLAAGYAALARGTQPIVGRTLTAE